jgi:hypothetical protein
MNPPSLCFLKCVKTHETPIMSRINFAQIFIWNTADQPPCYRLLCVTRHWKAENTRIQATLVSLVSMTFRGFYDEEYIFFTILFQFFRCKMLLLLLTNMKSCHLKARILSFNLIGHMQQSVVNQLNGSFSKRQ